MWETDFLSNIMYIKRVYIEQLQNQDYNIFIA